jgi:hypothetical protein
VAWVWVGRSVLLQDRNAWSECPCIKNCHHYLQRLPSVLVSFSSSAMALNWLKYLFALEDCAFVGVSCVALSRGRGGGLHD